jgi:hypothetical protein
VAGVGIQLDPSGASKSLTINSTKAVGSINGSGITVSPAIPIAGELVYNVAANLVAGTGVQITSSVSDKSKTISNSGVTQVAVSGPGLSTSGATGNITLANTGVTQVTVGTGLSTSGPTGGITLQNTGVTAINAGAGLSGSGTTGSITLNNTGATSIVAGTGVSVSGTLPGGRGDVTVNNTGLLGLTAANAGSGITISGTATNPTITAASAGINYYNLSATGFTLSGGNYERTFAPAAFQIFTSSYTMTAGRWYRITGQLNIGATDTTAAIGIIVNGPGEIAFTYVPVPATASPNNYAAGFMTFFQATSSTSVTLALQNNGSASVTLTQGANNAGTGPAGFLLEEWGSLPVV